MTEDKDNLKLNLSNNDKKLFAELQDTSMNGEYEKSIIILNKLIENNPKSAMFHAFLANTYWDMHEKENALRYFQYALNIEPINEKISVGLFHLLLELDKEEEAFSEVKRFVNDGGVMDRYRELLAEINDD